MMMHYQRIFRTALLLLTAFSVENLHAETVVDFEELTNFDATLPAPFGFQLLGAGDVFNGYADSAPTGEFVSQGVSFPTGPPTFPKTNSVFSYSRFNETSVPGFTNQFAAWPGGGSDGAGGVIGGSTYGMVFTGASTEADGTPTNGSSLTFAQSVELNSVDIANTTYAVQYFLNGLDGFNPEPDTLHQFVDGDFFTLRITGFDGVDGTGNETGAFDFDLARFSGAIVPGEDYVDGWETVDLSSFGATRSLRFSTTASQISDGGIFGFNHDVPAYAAFDNLRFVTAVPEPGIAGVALLGMGVLALQRRRRSA